jgi:predicted enzyme related to lactoylglutathione lyase
MATRIKHLAIVSGDHRRLGEFYESAFGMKLADGGATGAGGAVTVSDGYVGLNINFRRPGRQGGFDHFGFEVDDVDQVFERLQQRYPKVEWLKRPSNRPFAGITTHDPAGNVFDLSQAAMENRRGLYAESANAGSSNPRRVAHFQVRAVEPEALAEFYTEVYDLKPEDKEADDPNFYLSDGVVTLVVAPWHITHYAGTGIERPTPEHIGFAVESMERFKSDLDEMIERTPALTPAPITNTVEGEVRMRLFESCRYGSLHLADPDGVLLDVTEAPAR